MASQIEICNLALSHLGLNGITNILANNPSSIACNNNFELSVKDILSEHRWPFCTVYAQLTSVSDTVLQLEWDYVYVYPVKALAVWDVYNESTVDKKYEQEFEVVFQPSENRKVICSNLASAYAEQSYYVADTQIYSPKAAILLSWRLAAAIAHKLTGDVDVGLQAYKTYIGLLEESKRLSYSEKNKKPKQTSGYVNSR